MVYLNWLYTQKPQVCPSSLARFSRTKGLPVSCPFICGFSSPFSCSLLNPQKMLRTCHPPTSGNKNHLTPFFHLVYKASKLKWWKIHLIDFFKMSGVLRRHSLWSLTIYTICERVLFCTWFRVGMCLTEQVTAHFSLVFSSRHLG